MHGGECCKNGILGRMLEENVLVFPAALVRRRVISQLMLIFHIVFVVILGWILSERTESPYYLGKNIQKMLGREGKKEQLNRPGFEYSQGFQTI